MVRGRYRRLSRKIRFKWHQIPYNVYCCRHPNLINQSSDHGKGFLRSLRRTCVRLAPQKTVAD